MIQAPYAPPLILEATNRKTVGTGVVDPVNIAVVAVQGPGPSTGSGKRRRPPVTDDANEEEVPVADPQAARPCRKARRIGRARIRRIPTPGGRLSNRALQSTSCDASTQKGL